MIPHSIDYVQIFIACTKETSLILQTTLVHSMGPDIYKSCLFLDLGNQISIGRQ